MREEGALTLEFEECCEKLDVTRLVGYVCYFGPLGFSWWRNRLKLGRTAAGTLVYRQCGSAPTSSYGPDQ